MRKIKFRAHENKLAVWHYGSLLTPTQYDFSSYIQEDDGNEVEIDWETVGQFTGLKDKNGKEIYEGDIVKCMFGEQHQFDTTVDIDDIRYINEYVEHADVIEVIGNIHEKGVRNDKI